MKIEIKNKFSGSLLFSVEAENWRIALELAVKQGANLRGANLRGAYLQGAYLRGAYLQDADLRGAYLRGAYLQDADLQGAYLQDADLQGAYLRGADLRGAKDIPEQAIVQSRILPEGDIIGWKKCQDGVIVKLLISSAVKRSHAFGRKCRAQQVKVLEVFGAKIGVSQFRSKIYNTYTNYIAGETVECDKWEEDFTIECGGGIHFFITRLEAEQY